MTAIATVACSDSGGEADTDEAQDVAQDSPTQSDSPREALAPPLLDRVEPDSGPLQGGLQLLLIGDNLTTPADVFFGDIEAGSVSQIDLQTLAALLPAAGGAGLVDVTVETLDGRVTLEDGFRYLDPSSPFVESLDPAEGRRGGGDTVVINGRNFPTEGNVNVFFGENVAGDVQLDNETRFEVTTPAGPRGTVDVTFSFMGEILILPDAFRYR